MDNLCFWLVVDKTPPKNMKYEFVNWDDEIPEWKNKTCSSHHQPDIHDKQILRDSHT